MITNPQRQILLLRAYQFSSEPAQNEYAEVVAQDENLRAAYQKIRIAAESPFFTLIPERLYNSTEKKTYLQEITNLSYEKDIRADELQAAQARLIYALPPTITGFVQKQWLTGQLYHAVTAFISGLMQLAQTPSVPVLYVQVYPGWLVAVLLEGKNLLFVNTFHYQHAKDFLYFILLIFDQYKLTPEDTPVSITGQLIEQSEIYPLLRRYIRIVQFLPTPNFLQLGTKWQQQPTYFHFNLFGLTQL